jgi:hypothetical protein
VPVGVEEIGTVRALTITVSGACLFEIGLGKSVSATDKEISVQFLVESVTLSVAGAASASPWAWAWSN